MIKLIAPLDEKGLILRREVDGNRRSLEAHLTERGQRLLAACEETVDRVEATFFGALGPGELANFRKLLLQILGCVRAADHSN